MLESPKSIAELTGLFQKQSLNDANDSDLSYRLAKLYLRNGEFEEAKSILKKLLKESGVKKCIIWRFSYVSDTFGASTCKTAFASHFERPFY
jgi:pentatricopeptide repeat protein